MVTNYTCKNNNVHNRFIAMTDAELTIPYVIDDNDKLVPDEQLATKLADKVNEEILDTATADFDLHLDWCARFAMQRHHM
jgi:hypothetical protein